MASTFACLRLEALAWLSTTERDPERAPTLLGAVDEIWRVIGMSLTEIPFFAGYRAEAEAAARGSASLSGRSRQRCGVGDY